MNHLLPSGHEPAEGYRLALFYSPSAASGWAIREIIQRYAGHIKLVIAVSQLRGGLIGAAIRLWGYRNVHPRFLFYKLSDRLHPMSLEPRLAARACRIRYKRTNAIERVVSLVRHMDLDLGISFFTNQIFPSPLLDAFQDGILNVHGSCLPEGRGAAQYWHVLRGTIRAGATVHLMDIGLDTGPIVSQRRFSPSYNLHLIHEQMATHGAELLRPVLDNYLDTGKINSTPQPQIDYPVLKLPRLKYSRKLQLIMEKANQ